MGTPEPRVTIGLPIYNGERFLRECVDSLLDQSFTDFELVISDNASTDATEAICRAYAANDARVRYLRYEENRGLAWNHNNVVREARGNLFKWVGADDRCLPEYLAACVEALDGEPEAVLAYPRSIAIDPDGTELYRYSPDWNLRSESPGERLRQVIIKGGHWVNADSLSGVIRIDALRATRLQPAYLGGDKRPLGELSLVGKFLEVPEYLHVRRFHEESSGKNNPSESGYDARSVEWIARFFKGSRFEAYMPTWALLRDHIRTIWRSDLSFRRKLSVTGAVPRVCYWNARVVLLELRNSGRVLFGGFRRSRAAGF